METVQKSVPGRPWLKPWPKGVSGNPSGRPKKPITDAYNRKLVKAACDKISDAMIRQAKRGSVKAAIELADRTEGKVVQPVSGELNIQHEYRLDLSGLSDEARRELRELAVRQLQPARSDQ